MPGCSRQFWRNQADKDTYSLVDEKQTDEQWDLPRIDLEPDPRSRFYDPYPIDKGPLPPDDPAAHEYMHQADWIPGYKSWHKFGDAFSVENPQWYDSFEQAPVRNKFRDFAESDDASEARGSIQQTSYEDEGSPDPTPYEEPLGEPSEGTEHDSDNVTDAEVEFQPKIEHLTLQQAIELSQIHSREYQTQIEEVYLEALALTLSRFQFDVRYLGFGGTPSIGLNQTTNGNGQNSTLSMSPRAGINQLLPTGGQWILELSNNTLWLFSGDNQTSTSSLLSYSLVQPLMQGAGRKIVLANLTQQERNVLYSVRDLARFRQTFFTNIVSDYLSLFQSRQGIINATNNVSQTEVILDRSRVLASNVPENISEALDSLPDGVEIPAGLADKVRYNVEGKQLTVNRSITEDQEIELRQLSGDENFQKAVNDILDRLHTETLTLAVTQLETNLANLRNALRSSEVGYQNQLDQYKFQLGLPPDMTFSLDETFLEPFTLIDDRLFILEKEVTSFVDVWGQMDETDPPIEALRDTSRQFEILLAHVKESGLNLVIDDKRRFDQIKDHIIADKDPEDKERLEKDIERDTRVLKSVQDDIAEIERDWRLIEARLSNDNLTKEERQSEHKKLADLREDLLKATQNLQVIQVGVRVEMIELNKFDIDLEEAVNYALENRLDLMNARAAVMDARRAVEVAANELEGVLDVVVEGDIGTKPGSKPFEFRADRSTFRTGLQFTTPLNQISQRNQYRAALIAYQRARRTYMQTEDSVKIQVRRDWRQLKVLKKNFEMQRRTIRSSSVQFDQAVENAANPAQAGNPSSQQGLNLVNALNSILNAQNSFIGIWVNYEQNRLNIYQDMGMMDIDSQGIWDDAYYQSWSQTGKPVINGASTPSMPQGARRVIPTDHDRQYGEHRIDDGRKPVDDGPGVVLASAESRPRRIEVARVVAAEHHSSVDADDDDRRGDRSARHSQPVVAHEGKFLPPRRPRD
ncbi:MAG: TolC family protein [Planctomycetaceae bacterium]